MTPNVNDFVEEGCSKTNTQSNSYFIIIDMDNLYILILSYQGDFKEDFISRFKLSTFPLDPSILDSVKLFDNFKHESYDEANLLYFRININMKGINCSQMNMKISPMIEQHQDLIVHETSS